MTARFNIYFNGKESFKSGIKNINKNITDDYSDILPVYKYTLEEAKSTGASDMDYAIQKSAKAISNHSITVKPKMKNRKNGLSQKEIDFYNKSEYCKWVDDCYLLMGKAHYIKGDYVRAINSFRLIMNQYKTEETRFEAMLWLSKVYAAQNKIDNAIELLNSLENDVRHSKKLDLDINLTFADYYIKKENYTAAIPYIEKGIELSKGKYQKSRNRYILAQLHQKLNNEERAAYYYKRVIKKNPPYVMAFNAKINLATVLTADNNPESIKKDLKKMLNDDKNVDFQDQIYYALAEIEKKQNNEQQAINYYKLSASKSVSNNTQKSFSYLALANIYFSHPDYKKAGAYFDSTMHYLPTSYSEYDEISKKARNLSALIKNLNEAEYQDSIQRIAKLPKAKQEQIITNIISEIIRKEEEAKNRQNTNTMNDPYGLQNKFRRDGDPKFSGKWYMYNPTALSYGQSEFKKKWGDRDLTDNWRRKNKSVQTNFNAFSDGEDNQENTDPNNLKSVEYYLKKLPHNDSLMAVSEQKEARAMYNAGEIYYMRLNDHTEAIKTLELLNSRNAGHYLLLDTYFLLYKICKDAGNNSKANVYKNLIINKFPESKYAKLLQDPNYIKELQQKEALALNLFETTYEAYNNKQYQKVINNCKEAENNFNDCNAYSKFVYLKAMAYGELNNQVKMVEILESFINDYQNDDLVPQANKILYLIKSGKFDQTAFINNFDTNHFYVILYKKDAPNVNMLKFLLNSFTAEYSDKFEFNISDFEWDNTYSSIHINSFKDSNEATDFYKKLVESFTLKDIGIDDYEHFMINQKNYEILKKEKQINAYVAYFKNNYL